MNRNLFLDGFIDSIAKRFGLSKDFAFEVLAIVAVLDLTFDEVMDNVSTLEKGSGAHDGGMDGILIDEEDAVMHVFQVKSKNLLIIPSVARWTASLTSINQFLNS